MFDVPNKPLAATCEEWRAWTASARKNHPVRYWLSETLPLWWRRAWRRWVHEPWYWLKCRLWKRYNVVVCKRLPPTWCDRDHLMLHACFQLLEDFVEKEDPYELRMTREQMLEAYSFAGADGVVDTSGAEERVAAAEELRGLLAWWRGYDMEEWDPNCGERREVENEKLHRLIELRAGMWT